MIWNKKTPNGPYDAVRTSPVEKPICHGKTPIHVDRWHENWKKHQHDCKEKGCGATFTPSNPTEYEKHHKDN